MENYILGFILPVISLNDYSERAIKKVGEVYQNFPALEFIFICADNLIVEKIRLLVNIHDFNQELNNIKIINGNSISSNYLRREGYKHVNSNYVYYQDCDDFVDYAFLSEFCKNYYPNNSHITCFNISREIFDEFGNYKSRKTLYKWRSNVTSNKNGIFIPNLLDNLDLVPTNIVNKIIPKSCLDEVIFLNLPFTQDWSISYQLFLLSDHFLFDYNTYVYNNYPQSSAHVSKTTLFGLKRVLILKKFLVKLYKGSKYYKKSANLLSFKFELMLQQKFLFLKIPYFPRPPYPIIYFIIRNDFKRVLKIGFQLIRSIFLLSKFILASSINKIQKSL